MPSSTYSGLFKVCMRCLHCHKRLFLRRFLQEWPPLKLFEKFQHFWVESITNAWKPLLWHCKNPLQISLKCSSIWLELWMVSSIFQNHSKTLFKYVGIFRTVWEVVIPEGTASGRAFCDSVSMSGKLWKGHYRCLKAWDNAKIIHNRAFCAQRMFLNTFFDQKKIQEFSGLEVP